jgi:hypothetical protein
MEFDAKPLKQMHGTLHVSPFLVGNLGKFSKHGRAHILGLVAHNLLISHYQRTCKDLWGVIALMAMFQSSQNVNSNYDPILQTYNMPNILHKHHAPIPL